MPWRPLPSGDAPDPLGRGATPDLRGRRARPASPCRRAAAQPPRGRRGHLRRDARGGPGRGDVRGGRDRRPRGRGLRTRCSTASASCWTRCAWRCCSAMVAGDRAAGSAGRGGPLDPLGPGALVIGDRADIEVNEGRETHRDGCDEPSRRRVRDLVALPVPPREHAPRVRPRGRPRVPPRPAGGRVRGLGAGRDEDRAPGPVRGPSRSDAGGTHR